MSAGSGASLAYLDLLFSGEAGSFVELRRRAAGGMVAAFYPVERLVDVIEAVQRLGKLTEVYVGVAPRTRESGKREAIERSHVVWLDVDDELALERLRRFRPRPSMVIETSPGHDARLLVALAAGGP